MSIVLGGTLVASATAVPQERFVAVSRHSNVASFQCSTSSNAFLDMNGLVFGRDCNSEFSVHDSYGRTLMTVGYETSYIPSILQVKTIKADVLSVAGTQVGSNVWLTYDPSTSNPSLNPLIAIDRKVGSSGGVPRLFGVYPDGTAEWHAAVGISTAAPRAGLDVASNVRVRDGLWAGGDVESTSRLVAPEAFVGSVWGSNRQAGWVFDGAACNINGYGNLRVWGDFECKGTFVFPGTIGFEAVEAKRFTMSNVGPSNEPLLKVVQIGDMEPAQTMSEWRRRLDGALADAPLATLDQYGRLGLGTSTPTFALQVEPLLLNGVGNADVGGPLCVRGSATGCVLALDASGHLGVGVTAPTTVLDVRAAAASVPTVLSGKGLLHLTHATDAYSTAPFSVFSSNACNVVVVNADGGVWVRKVGTGGVGDNRYGVDVGDAVRTPFLATCNIKSDHPKGYVSFENSDVCNVSILKVDRIVARTFISDTTEFANIYSQVVNSPAFAYVKDTTHDQFNVVSPDMLVRSGRVAIASSDVDVLQALTNGFTEKLRVVQETFHEIANTSVPVARFVGRAGLTAVGLSNAHAEGSTQLEMVAGDHMGRLIMVNGTVATMGIAMDTQTMDTMPFSATPTGIHVGNMIHGDINGQLFVGYSESPSAVVLPKALQVKGSARFENALLAPILVVDAESDILNAATYHQRVGIGTLSPQQTLDVCGTVALNTSAGASVMAVDASGNTTFGGTVTLNNLVVNGTYTGPTFSDRRLKDNVVPLGDALDAIASMRGYSFEWKDTGKPAYGLMADEVRAAMPHAVSEGADGFLRVDYPQLTAMLVEALRAMQVRLEALERGHAAPLPPA